MTVTLDQLRVLDVIERLGSFTAAGRELRRATSAVSYAIRSLEEALGVELFDRSGHRASLTPAGELVVREARTVIDRVRNIEHLAGQLRGEWEPILHVVLDGVIPMSPVMRAMRRFHRQGAPTRLQLVTEYLSGVPERFEELGAALMVSLEVVADPGLRARALPDVEMLLVAHRDHPLHELNRPRTREQLAAHVELVVPDSGRAAPRSPPVPLGSPHIFRLSDFHAKREALLGGVGFGWLPAHLARESMTSGELRLVGFEEGDRHVFAPRLVERRELASGRAAQAFASYLSEELAARAPMDAAASSHP